MDISKVMIGKISLDELEEMTKGHPRSSINIAYGEGVLVGIGRAKEKFKSNAKAQREYIERLEVALKSMVDMIDSGDEHGSGSEWHIKAKYALASKPKDIV